MLRPDLHGALQQPRAAALGWEVGEVQRVHVAVALGTADDSHLRYATDPCQRRFPDICVSEIHLGFITKAHVAHHPQSHGPL